MALSFIVIGLLLLVSAVQNTQGQLFALVKEDFTGKDSFVQWLFAIAFVGAIGFIPRMKGFSVALLTLVLLAIFLKRGTGFFDQLASAFGTSTAPTQV